MLDDPEYDKIRLKQAADDGIEYSTCLAEINRLRAQLDHFATYKPIAWMFVAGGVMSVFFGHDQLAAPLMILGLGAGIWLYIHHTSRQEILERLGRLERRATIIKTRLEAL